MDEEDYRCEETRETDVDVHGLRDSCHLLKLLDCTRSVDYSEEEEQCQRS